MIELYTFRPCGRSSTYLSTDAPLPAHFRFRRQLAGSFSAKSPESPQPWEGSTASASSKLAGLTPRSLPFTFGTPKRSKPHSGAKRMRRGEEPPPSSLRGSEDGESENTAETMASCAMRRVESGPVGGALGGRRPRPAAGFSPSLSRPPTTPGRSPRSARPPSAVRSRLRTSNLGGGTPQASTSRPRDFSGLATLASLPGSPSPTRDPLSRLPIAGLFSPPTVGSSLTPAPTGAYDSPGGAAVTYSVVLQATPGMTSAQLLASLRKSGIRPEQVQVRQAGTPGAPCHALSSPFSDSSGSDDYPPRS